MEYGSVFGYTGRPGFGYLELATFFVLVGLINTNKNFSATVYYGHALGDQVVENVYNDQRNADFFLSGIGLYVLSNAARFSPGMNAAVTRTSNHDSR